jgi:glycosyltransferase involved in cell wall biosynthesis
VLPDLAGGGAERLVAAYARANPDVAVATVFGAGPLLGELAGLGAARLTLGERRHGRPSAAAFARLVAAARRADVVHTHLFAGDLWGGLAARVAGRPQVSHEHNVDVDEGPHVRRARRVSGLLPACAVAVSEAAARHSFARRVRVVPNGVDLGRFTRPWRGGEGLLAIGRRVPQKGFDLLLQALPAGARLRVAGDGPFAPVHPQVEWLGARDDVPDLLVRADALVVPSRWEGFGLAALEGLAAGTPVVAFDVPALRDLLGDAAVLVPAGDVQALAAALVRVLGDEALRATLSGRGRLRAARFALQATFDAWERAGDEAVRGE